MSKTIQDATLLIDQHKIIELIDNLDQYESKDHPAIVNYLIKKGYGQAVATNLKKFEGLDDKTAQQLFENNYDWAVAANLNKFEGLDASIAQQLIVQGYGRSVINNIQKFNAEDHPAIAQQLITNGKGWLVADNLNKLTELDHPTIAQQLIKLGYTRAVAANIDKFEGLDASIAQHFIKYNYDWVVAENIEKFKGLDYTSIAQQLIKNRYGPTIAENLDKFVGLELHVVDTGERGSGNNITGYYITNSQDREPNIPTPALVIQAGCVTFSGDTPEETIKAIKENMENKPPQWRNATPIQIKQWTQDVNQALEQITQATPLALTR